MKETVKDLHKALSAVLEIDPDAKYRFVNHGSGTYSLDFEIDPTKMTEKEFSTLGSFGVWDGCDEEDSHEECVRGLCFTLIDEFQAHCEEHEARLAAEKKAAKKPDGLK